VGKEGEKTQSPTAGVSSKDRALAQNFVTRPGQAEGKKEPRADQNRPQSHNASPRVGIRFRGPVTEGARAKGM